jgi:hypothetical protein
MRIGKQSLPLPLQQEVILGYGTAFSQIFDDATSDNCKCNVGMHTSFFTPGTFLITPWPLVRERTLPTERPPLVDEI